ncbi:hypothetical protein [Paludisphaera rhizosphaerae]|uniref:hypothetical protein n=1 Tax=Paludisphaera rhizosphaerae TaxID=2711216 RepID=UPI0013EBDAA7|nr:hypothetical protein [Paludisphaera rhizosphaerae]
MQAYDESRALRFYLFDHCPELLTPEERLIVRDARLGRSILAYKEGGEPRLAVMLGRKLHDPEFASLDEQALDAREMSLARAVLARVGDEVVQRCGRCGRILNTPRAQQCFLCGHDWHKKAGGPAPASG